MAGCGSELGVYLGNWEGQGEFGFNLPQNRTLWLSISPDMGLAPSLPYLLCHTSGCK